MQTERKRNGERTTAETQKINLRSALIKTPGRKRDSTLNSQNTDSEGGAEMERDGGKEERETERGERGKRDGKMCLVSETESERGENVSTEGQKEDERKGSSEERRGRVKRESETGGIERK